MRVRVISCATHFSGNNVALNFIFLLFAVTGIAAKSYMQIYNFKAFGDFLKWQQLQHGIVVCNATTQLLRSVEFQQLVGQYRIRFYNAAGRDKDKNFSDNFYYSSPRVGVFLNELLDVELQQRVLQAAALGDFFNNSQAWFITTRQCDSATAAVKISNIFGHLNINISADITVAVKAANNSLQLYDVYNICQNTAKQLQIEEKGFWYPDLGFIVKPQFLESYVIRRRNWCNISLRAGTPIIEKPQNMSLMQHLENTHDNMQLDVMQRKTYRLFKMLEPMFNVSFQVIFSDTWGSFLNGSWNGVISQMLAHEVEFAIVPMRFTLERVYCVQFTPELHTEFILFLFRHPRRNAIRNIFFEPFADEVWCSVFALIALIVLLLAIHVQHAYKQQQRRKLAAHESHVERRLDYVVLTILEAIFMQGPSPDAFSANSTRILILCTCVFSVMLLQFYSAFIVGSLLADVPRSITTLEALYNSSLEVGMENITYNYEIFTNTTNALAHDIYTKRICRNAKAHILTIQQGAARIQRGGFAFHVSANRMYRILKANMTQAEFCDLQEILLNAPFTAPAALRKNSAYREHFAHGILHLRATGLMQYNDRQWQIHKPDCSLSQDREVEVDMQHFIPALMFLAFAMLLSVGVCLLELCCSWLRTKWRHSKQNEATSKKTTKQGLEFAN